MKLEKEKTLMLIRPYLDLTENQQKIKKNLVHIFKFGSKQNQKPAKFREKSIRELQQAILFSLSCL